MPSNGAVAVQSVAGYLILRIAEDYALIGNPLGLISPALERKPTLVIADTRGGYLSSAMLGVLLHINKLARAQGVELLVLVDEKTAAVMRISHLDKLLRTANEVPDTFPPEVRAVLDKN